MEFPLVFKKYVISYNTNKPKKINKLIFLLLNNKILWLEQTRSKIEVLSKINAIDVGIGSRDGMNNKPIEIVNINANMLKYFRIIY